MTRLNRASIIGLCFAPALVLPAPGGASIDQATQQAVAYSYAGILAKPAVVGQNCYLRRLAPIDAAPLVFTSEILADLRISPDGITDEVRFLAPLNDAAISLTPEPIRPKLRFTSKLC